jgi:hypothetical protein
MTNCKYLIRVSERHLLPLQRNALRIEAPVDDAPRCTLQKKAIANNMDPFRWVASGGDERTAFRKCGIYPYMNDCETCYIRMNHDLETENDELREDYTRALKVVERLRLEIKVLRDERKHLFDFLQEAHKMPDFQNPLKKAAVVILRHKLEKERLI